MGSSFTLDSSLGCTNFRVWSCWWHMILSSLSQCVSPLREPLLMCYSEGLALRGVSWYSGVVFTRSQQEVRENALCLLQQHWNENVVILTKFSSLAAPEVVKMTTSSAASDENVIKITTFPFQWMDGSGGYYDTSTGVCNVCKSSSTYMRLDSDLGYYTKGEQRVITVTSWWTRWRIKSPASRLFTQPLIQAQIKENIKAPHHWPLWGEFTVDQWIPRTKGQ